MPADVREGRINGLVFSKLALLARNIKEILEFFDMFSEYKRKKTVARLLNELGYRIFHLRGLLF